MAKKAQKEEKRTRFKRIHTLLCEVVVAMIRFRVK